jgi:hypothetical protein
MLPARLLAVLAVIAATSPAWAAIEKTGSKPASSKPPLGSIAVPHSSGPLRFECWQDGERVIVEAAPGTALPLAPPNRTMVVRQSDGRVTTITMLDNSGCLVTPSRHRGR